ncbi:MAG: hypothetical protein A2546_06630 [Sphingobacteriia bacterium RIFOXYD2_FULL_35_12]|nr:MAG: hypothetical protein A2472_10385 [Sphingobacteriia bacterium RIFOXYC2_FULL_35_18]OHC88869.1 MAG: hypothetical protein A2546_06630 [Sphingobacteriia bacterium RIFOXYD2_FULL_35_12]
MRQITATIISILFFTGCSNSQPNQKEAEIFLKNINATEFKKLVDAGNGITLDVRTPEEIADGYINNASIVNYYDEDFEKKINLIPKDKEIYILQIGWQKFRSSGNTSKKWVQSNLSIRKWNN